MTATMSSVPLPFCCTTGYVDCALSVHVSFFIFRLKQDKDGSDDFIGKIEVAAGCISICAFSLSLPLFLSLPLSFSLSAELCVCWADHTERAVV